MYKQLVHYFLIGSLLIGLLPMVDVDTGSLYTRSFTINNTLGSVQSNYPIDYVFNTAAEVTATRMRSDCGDLRVLDTNGYTIANYAILNCNATWTSVVFKIPSLPTGVSGPYYLRYGNPAQTSAATPTQVFDIYDLWSASTCTIAGVGAAWDSGNNWLRLTQNLVTQTGTCNYNYTSALASGGYRAWFDAWAGGTVNGVDSIWQYSYDSAIPAQEDITLGGAHFTADEGQNRVCYTRSVTSNGGCTSTFGIANLDNSTWRTIKVSFDSVGKRMFLDGVQRINTTGGTAVTLANTNFGLAARTSAVTNEHRVRRLALIRYSESVVPSAISGLIAPPSSRLSFAIRNSTDTANSTQICDYGDVVTTTTYSCQYRLKVDSNASGGYTIFATTSGNFLQGGAFFANAIPGTGGAGGTAVTIGSEVYGVTVAPGQCTGSTSVPNAFSGASGNAVQFNYVAPTAVMSCNSTNSPLATDLTNTTLIDHRLAITGNTPAGIYTQSVTWTIVPNF